MKTRALQSSVVMVLLTILSAFAWNQDEKPAVIKVVEEAYVQGVHANPDGEAMRQGFHAEFIMFVQEGSKINKVTRDEWITRIEAAKAKSANKPRSEIKAEFPLVEVTGSAAIVKVELYRDGKHTFTDYISLYKFEEGWKIVAKTFYRHPAKSE
ncbi:nuclear transport factor 2 family protein [candidate division KSB1 bacterium]|nr:nuclear transport factor 2 family protein [candidate division KSB1 bacterium]